MSLNSHRNLGMTGNMQAKSAQRLSSGFRINSAADDAAGLGISETMRAQIRGLDQASRNSQDGISLIQTAEGALSTVNEMVTRVRELVVQSGNDTNTDDDRSRIQNEIDQLKTEINEVSERTEFNTQQLLSGTRPGTLTNLSANAIAADGVTDDATAQQFIDFLSDVSEFNSITGWDINTAPADSTALDLITDVITAFNNFVTTSDLTNLTALDAAVTAAGGSTGWTVPAAIADEADAQNFLDMTSEVMSFNRQMDDGGSEFTFQVGANADQQITVTIDSMDWNSISNDLQIDLVAAGSDIGDLLNALDDTLGVVTAQRSELGAVQNRLEFTIENLDIASENLSAAESRIRDADMAKEMMRFTQSNVLQQAAISMLSQANQAPQSILQLLG